MGSREIIFRGKTEQGEWVYGNLIAENNCIVGELLDIYEDYENLEWWQPVIPSTIGQFTGLKDKNGTKIFEGDKVQCYHGVSYQGTYEHTNQFIVDLSNWQHLMELSECNDVFIIGIHEEVQND